MNRAFLLAAALMFFSSVDDATAQAPPGVEIQRLQISVTSGRPVAAAILEIERRHGVAISYEDLPIVYTEDVRDVTAEVRRDLATFAARGEVPPPVIVPRGGAVNLSYDTNRLTGVPIDLEGVLAEVLQANTRAGNAGTFRVVAGRGITHVIPVARRDATGVVAAVAPVLDSEIISLSLDTNGFLALIAFCEALSSASGQTVLPGTMPTNLFGNTSITLDENQGVAREILVDILAQIPRRLAWQLFYDPGKHFYALNIHVVE